MIQRLLAKLKLIRPRHLATILFLLAIIIIFSGILFLAISRNRNGDNLAQFVPADAQIYIHLNYLPLEQSGTPAEKFFSIFFDDIDERMSGLPPFDISVVKNHIDREIGLYLNKDDNWYFVIKILKPKEIKNIISGQKTIIFAGSRYLIAPLDTSAPAPTIIKRQQSIVKNNRWLSAYDRGLLKIFLRPEILQKNLSFPIFSSLLQNYLKNNDIKAFYISADKNFNFNIKSSIDFGKGANLITKKLPPSTTFSIAAENFLNFSRLFSVQLQKFSPKEFLDLFSTWQAYEQTFRFSFPEIEKYLDNQTQIIITKEDNKLFYTFIIKNKDKNSLETVNRILQNILAHQYPEKVKRSLPDKSIYTELVANPKRFDAKTEIIGKYELKYLEAPKLKIIFGQIDDVLILSTSLDATKQLINGEKNINLTSFCQKIANPQMFFNFQETMANNFLARYREVFSISAFKMTDYGISGCLK
ncbi:MAG: hypothetical protein WC310_02250 [Patescibacteria group bacterium]|jgi:hypothetical protein